MRLVYVAHTPDGDDAMTRVGGVFARLDDAKALVERVCARDGEWRDQVNWGCEDGLQWVYRTGPTFDDPLGYISQHWIRNGRPTRGRRP
jgi:hypothetical protein